MKKLLCAVILMCVVSAFPAYATAVKVEAAGGYWQQLEDRSWNYYDNYGNLVCDSLSIINGKVYYLEPDGHMAENVEIDLFGAIYSFGKDGDAKESVNASYVLPPEGERSETANRVIGYVDGVLASITRPEMSVAEKAKAIYDWIQGNFKYVKMPAGGDRFITAYEMIRKKTGDCYAFYCLTEIMLARAGIESKPVVRSWDGNHFWNMVKTDDGMWYHFDTCPRRPAVNTCLVTDTFLFYWSAQHYDCFVFDLAKYPRTP